MSLAISAFPVLAALNVTQADLDDLLVRVRARTWFNLAIPDPEFSGFTVEEDDQLPGRPLSGEIEIATIFERLKLLVTDEQQKGLVNGETIFDHLKAHSLPVLGPNVGQLLHDNQELIPVELRGKVVLVFWGKIYRDSGRGRYVRCLCWGGGRWVWDFDGIDDDSWSADDRAVMLASRP